MAKKKQKDCTQRNTKAPDKGSAAVIRPSRHSFARVRAATQMGDQRVQKTSAPSSEKPPTSKSLRQLPGNSEGFPPCKQPP
jgi:hypothetical protein